MIKPFCITTRKCGVAALDGLNFFVNSSFFFPFFIFLFLHVSFFVRFSVSHFLFSFVVIERLTWLCRKDFSRCKYQPKKDCH